MWNETNTSRSRPNSWDKDRNRDQQISPRRRPRPTFLAPGLTLRPNVCSRDQTIFENSCCATGRCGRGSDSRFRDDGERWTAEQRLHPSLRRRRRRRRRRPLFDNKHMYDLHMHVTEGTLKMHDLKMTDKENYGSGKCRTGKWRTNF